jgi:hypothetical protein
MEKMIACMEKGDMGGMGHYVVEPAGPKLVKMGEAVSALSSAVGKLRKAVDGKFGAGTADSLRIRAEEPPKAEKIEIVEVKEEGAKATVKTKMTTKGGGAKEETLTLVKVGDAWFANPPGEFDEKALDMFEKAHGAFLQNAKDTEALAADVESGKVANKEEAGKRYGEIQMAMAKAMMGGDAPK